MFHTRRYTTAWSAPCSTSPLLSRTLPMRYNMSASTCTILGSYISLPSSASCAICTTLSTSGLLAAHVDRLTPTTTRLASRTPAAPRQGSPCSSVTASSPDLAIVTRQSLVLVQMPSTASSQKASLRRPSFVSFYSSFTRLSSMPRSITVIMWVLSTSRRTRCNTNAPNMSRVTFTFP